MKVASVVLLFLFAALGCVRAQEQTSCPKITVSGPAGITPPGGLMTYTATIEDSGKYDLQYNWILSNGTIESGQGTPTLTVRQPDEVAYCLTVTLKVIGLPDTCTALASETGCGHPPPRSEKIDEFYGSLDSANYPGSTKIADALRSNPNSQLFVLVGSAIKHFDALRQSISSKLISLGISPDQMTFVEASTKVNGIQFWQVPPGATPPMPSELEKHSTELKCPKITVTGPVGISHPGTTMVFTANAPGDYRGGYKWSFTEGTIEEGLGTPTIRVRAPEKTVNVTATVELTDLPASCPRSGSQTAGVYAGGDIFPFDLYGKLTEKNDEMARLQTAYDQLASLPDGTVVSVIIQVPSKGRVTYRSRVNTIYQIVRRLRLDKDRFVFMGEQKGELKTTIYLIPRSMVSSFSRQ